jgi:SH3-like domain-containing protein
MSLGRPRSLSLSGLAVIAALSLVLGVVSGASALRAAAADEVPISPAVDRIVVVVTIVRAQPSHDAAAVDVLEAGERITVSAQVPAWRKVSAGGVSGWVPYSVTQEVPKLLSRLVPREVAATVTLRAYPGDKADAVNTPLRPVTKHTFASVRAVAGSWRKISTAHGAGWLPASALAPVSTGRWGFVASVDANVRMTGSSAAPIVHVLDKRDKVVVLGTSGPWSSVKWGAADAPAVSHSGWTATTYLTRADNRVTTRAVDLHNAKPWSGDVWTVLPKGARVLLTGRSVTDPSRTPQKWHEVTWGLERGWVPSSTLTWPF